MAEKPIHTKQRFTFSKQERLHKKLSIKELFDKGSSFRLYPLVIKYLPITHSESTDQANQHQVLVSVSKRQFKRAVKRNLIKRRIREAYRLNKSILTTSEKPLAPYRIAFIYTSREIHTFQEIEVQMQKALKRLVAAN
jgi:ribonuclease P protein component